MQRENKTKQTPRNRVQTNTATLAPVLSPVLATLFSATLPSTTLAIRNFEVLPYPQLLCFQSLSTTPATLVSAPLTTPTFAALSYSALLYLQLVSQSGYATLRQCQLFSADLATLISVLLSYSQLCRSQLF